METLEQEDEKGFFGFFRRRGVVLALVCLAMGAVIVGAARIGTLGRPVVHRPAPEIRTIRLPPPPPPPRPEPLPRPEPAPAPEQMIEQPAVTENDNKPPEAPKAAEAPSGALGTNIRGDGGSDAFGLSGSGSGNGLVGGGGGGGGLGGSRWGWYASKVQSQIQSALLENRKTRHATLRVTVRLWADSGGRIVRARLARSTGDARLDEALQNEVLGTLVLPEAPPTGMPMPIVLRITGGPTT